ncbi:uncharacterized protein PRCAT00002352001 [Priceomyces carsonii]|uniref:uncharacterized protein n=1 Tax=Priceomyces carsonii TaxID=28549 RepID=UPI002ED9B516|nr:unnamed protein product [Priceomyces carsonii]
MESTTPSRSYSKLSNAVVSDIELDSNSSTSNLLPSEELHFEDLNGHVSYLLDLKELPQGRHLGLYSTIVLFVSRILGSGIFSISSGIYQDCGHSGVLFFSAWIIGAVASFSGLYVFMELGSILPRNGGTKVFLEFIYEKPKYLASVAFLLYSLIFGFTISNCLVFGEYFLHSLGIETSDKRSRYTGLVFLYIAASIHGLSVGHGIHVQNIMGGLKLLLLLVMVATGIYLIVFPSTVTGIESNIHFDDFFKVKKDASVSTFASAIIKSSFAFGGWNSVHTVSSEIKDPIRTLKIAGPVSLAIITVTYLITNWAYLLVIPEKELANSGKLVGSIFFEKVFGYRIGKQFLTFAVAICAGGNIFVVIYTISRVSQEVFREGYFPFSRFMASNWPFDAPLPVLILSCLLTTVVIIFTPGGDIYNYVIALEGYPLQFFICLTAAGIFIIRKRYPEYRAPIRTTLTGAALVILIGLYLLISPLITSSSPNPKGTESWPSYAIIAIICLAFCVLYWVVMFKLFPWLLGYSLKPEEDQLSDGLRMRKWVKVYNNLPHLDVS